MKLSQVLAAREPLNKLSLKHFTNFKVVRAIAELVKSVNVEYDFFNTEFRKLLDMYAEKDEHGNPVVLTNGNIKLKDEESKKAFDEAYNDLMNLDVSEHVVPIIVVESDFKSPDDFLTPVEMISLDSIIDWGDGDTASKA